MSRHSICAYFSSPCKKASLMFRVSTVLFVWFFFPTPRDRMVQPASPSILTTSGTLPWQVPRSRAGGATGDVRRRWHGEEAGTGIIAEILDMLKANKQWWMIPLFLVFLLFGLLMLLSGTGMAPFIYSLF